MWSRASAVLPLASLASKAKYSLLMITPETFVRRNKNRNRKSCLCHFSLREFVLPFLDNFCTHIPFSQPIVVFELNAGQSPSNLCFVILEQCERTKFEIFATLDFEPVLQMSPFALDHSVCKLPRFNMNFPPFDLGPQLILSQALLLFRTCLWSWQNWDFESAHQFLRFHLFGEKHLQIYQTICVRFKTHDLEYS